MDVKEKLIDDVLDITENTLASNARKREELGELFAEAGVEITQTKKWDDEAMKDIAVGSPKE